MKFQNVSRNTCNIFIKRAGASVHGKTLPSQNVPLFKILPALCFIGRFANFDIERFINKFAS